MLRRFAHSVACCCVMGIAAQILEAVKRLATFAFSFYTHSLQGCDQGFYSKKRKQKKGAAVPIPGVEPGPPG